MSLGHFNVGSFKRLLLFFAKSSPRTLYIFLQTRFRNMLCCQLNDNFLKSIETLARSIKFLQTVTKQT